MTISNIHEQFADNPFIQFTSDYGFKATFGNESDTRFLRRALQAIIQSDIPITDVVFDKTEFPGVTKDSRSGLYDLICTDADKNTFIVEMQVGPFPNFIHRMKYYAFNKFNTMVKKGKYYFDDLTPIYCIGILSENIYNFENYYNYGLLKNQYNDIMDGQITYVTIELDKFKLTESDVKSDLEKLIFTMKNLPKYATDLKQPDFFTEEWLESAIKELDVRSFTSEQYEQYSNMLARTGTLVRAGKLDIENAIKERDVEAVIGFYENGVSVPIIAKSLKMREERVRQIIEEHQ